MYALDNSSGVTTMPVVKNQQFQPNAPRWFTEGGNGVSPSYPGADWFNIVQAELLGVLTEAHITAEKSNLNQLAKAIKEIIANNAPTKKHIHQITEVIGLQDALNQKANATDFNALHDLFIGIPIPYPISSVPTGCLAMNGQRFDTRRYPKLAQKYPSGQLPDTRGEFIRGWDNRRGVDAGRTLLSNQTDQTKEAFFEFQMLDIADSNISSVRGDARQETWQWNSISNNWEKIYSNKYNSYSINGTTTSGGFRELQANDMFKKFWIGSGNETRPRNIAYHYICLAE